MVAVEIDPTLARLLPTTVARHVPGLTVVAGADDEPVVLRDEAGRDRLTIVLSDALDVRALPGPPPVALVANLPYNVSVPVLLTFLERFDCLERVLVMVQAEVADRLAAPPGSRTYGVPSAKAAWYASARRTATVGRTVFWPAPNVDSALVRFDRREPPVTDASAGGGVRRRRRRVRAAPQDAPLGPVRARRVLRRSPWRPCEAAGVDPQARGERVDIAGFARIAEHLGPVGRPTWHGGAVTLTPVAPLPEHEVRVRAPGKINLSLRVGPREDDGYHAVSTVFQAVSVFEEVVATPSEQRTLTVSGPQAELVPTDGSNLALRAAALLAERAGIDDGVHLHLHKGVPVAGGMAGGSADAAATLVACDALWRTGLSRDDLLELAAELGSDVPFSLAGPHRRRLRPRSPADARAQPRRVPLGVRRAGPRAVHRRRLRRVRRAARRRARARPGGRRRR